uniref:Uncharacterized protein n=1 Tax=Anguilla anguilla TaxID=7936 RepID=A0A0E9XDZ7_ANGAN
MTPRNFQVQNSIAIVYKFANFCHGRLR